MKIELKIDIHIDMEPNVYSDMQQSLADTHAALVSQPRLLEQKKQELADTLTRTLQELSSSKRHKTVENYKTALKAFFTFLGQQKEGEVLTPATIEAFGKWLQDKGITLNTVSCYMRSLRSLLSVVDQQAQQLFRSVFTGSTKTEKRAIDEAVILKIKDLVLTDKSYLALARDVFLFSFYAQGMPFVDVAHLRRSQIARGRIVYARQKTGQPVSISILPCMTQIIDRYADSASERVFPLLPNDDGQQQTGYLKALNRYNRALKKLAALAGIADNLTSYVARHSWASVAYQSCVDLPVISKALGHANPQTTLTYIKDIGDDRLAEANRKLLSKFD